MKDGLATRYVRACRVVMLASILTDVSNPCPPGISSNHLGPTARRMPLHQGRVSLPGSAWKAKREACADKCLSELGVLAHYQLTQVSASPHAVSRGYGPAVQLGEITIWEDRNLAAPLFEQ